MSNFKYNGNYKCVCGREFTNSQAFNGHKSHCKLVFKNKNKDLKKLDYLRTSKAAKTRNKKVKEINNIKKQEFLKNWISEQHKCERCGKIMTEYFGSGRFCSKACANAHDYSDETRKKIGISLSNSDKNYSKLLKKYNEEVYYKNPNKCIVCGNILEYNKRSSKTCCKECYIRYDREIQKRINPVKRSKNEILFCNLCEEFFGKENILNNEKLFNGWDADIIIPKLKIAILWNGPWHYIKVTEKHNLEQVINRDKIKLNEIKKNNYIPYIIKDMGSENFEKVKLEFGLFLDYLINNNIV